MPNENYCNDMYFIQFQSFSWPVFCDVIQLSVTSACKAPDMYSAEGSGPRLWVWVTLLEGLMFSLRQNFNITKISKQCLSNE